MLLDELVVRLGGDVSGLSDALQQGVSAIQSFEARANQIGQKLPKQINFGSEIGRDLETALTQSLQAIDAFSADAESRVRDSSGRLRDAMGRFVASDAGIDQLRAGLAQSQQAVESFVQGVQSRLGQVTLLDADVLAKQGVEASQAYVAAVVDELRQLTADNLLPPEVGKRLEAQMQQFGKNAASALQGALRERVQVEIESPKALSQLTQDLKRATADFQSGMLSAEDYQAALERVRADLVELRAAGFQPTGQALNQFTAAMRQIDAGTKRVAAALDPVRATMDRLEREVAQATAAFRAGTSSQDAYRTRLAQIRAELVAIQASGFAPVGADLNRFNTLLQRTADKAPKVGTSLNMVRSGMAQLAVQSVSTTSAVGQVAQGLLLLGGGSAVVIGVAAGIALIGRAYEELTRESREANERLDDMIDRLRQIREQTRDPIVVAIDLAEGVETKLDQLQRRIATLGTGEAASAFAGPVASGFGSVLDGVFGFFRKKAEREFKAVDRLRSTASDNFNEEQRKADKEAVDALAKLISLGIARRTEQERATQLIRQYRDELKQITAEGKRAGETLTDFHERRAELEEKAQTLEGAFQVRLKLDDRALSRELRERVAGLKEQVQAVDVALTIDANLNPALAAIGEAFGVPFPVRIDTDAMVAEAKQGWADALTAIDSLGGIGTAPAALVEPFKQLGAKLAEVGQRSREEVERSAAALIQSSTKAREQLEGVTSLPLNFFGSLPAQVAAVAGATAQVKSEMGKVEAQIEAIGLPLATNLGLVAEWVRLAASIKYPEPPPVITPTLNRIAPDATEGLARLARDYTQAQAAYEAAAAAGNAEATATAQRNVKAIEQQIEAERRLLAARLLAEGVGPERITKALEEFDRMVGRAHTSVEGLGNELDALSAMARGVVEIADAFGGLDDNARKAVDGITLAIDALKQLKSAQGQQGFDKLLGQVSGVIGLVGAGVNILSGIFGETAQSKALRENSQALDDLRQELRQFDPTGIGNQARAAEAAARVAANEELLFQIRTRSQFAGRDEAMALTESDINRLLASMGITFDDLQAFAESQGLTLIDERGHVVADAFAQVAEAAGYSIEALTQFGTSFDEQLRRLDLESKLFGGPLAGTDPTAAFQRQIEALTDVAPDIHKLFEGIDLSTAEGQAAARELLQRLFRQFEDGFFTENPEALGGLSRDDWLRFLEQGADALNELATQAQALSDSFATQRQVLDVRAALSGADLADPTLALQRQIDALLGAAPDLFGGVFQGLDLGSEEGRQLARERLLALLDQLEAGLLDPALLAAFGGPEALLGALGSTADALNALEDSALEATRSMLNVPTGFKVAAARFAAEVAGLTEDLPSIVPVMTDTGSAGTVRPEDLLGDVDGAIGDAIADVLGGTGDAMGGAIAEAVAQMGGAAAETQRQMLETLAGIASTTPTDTLAALDTIGTILRGDVVGAVNRVVDALTAGAAPTVSALAVPPSIDWSGPPLAGSDVTLPRQSMAPAVVQRSTTTYAAGAIVIHVHQQPGESAEQLAQRIQRVYQQRARAQTGDTLQWGRL